MSKDELTRLRSLIDQVDAQLLEMLNKRAQVVIDVGELKSKGGSPGEVNLYRPEREAQVLQQVQKRNTGPLSNDQVVLIFKEIISLSLSLEQEQTIAYLGPPGTYSHSAVLSQFGRSVKSRSQRSIADVFLAVESGKAHFGVVPIENSTEGTVNQSLDCFVESKLKICSEIDLPIHHAFMVASNTDPDAISKIYSHEQSLAQCRDWINHHYPRASMHAVDSNSEAAFLASDQKGAAAIAGELAADRYHLDVLHTKIEDQKSNTTRFLVLGNQAIEPSGRDKTSLLVYTANKAGALADVLVPFKTHGISLSNVVSRPGKFGNWSYVFFIDVEGHEQDENVAAVLEEVRNEALEVRVLGSYPRALEVV